METRQQDHDQDDFFQELHHSRSDGPKDQDLAGEGDTPGEAGVLRKDVRARVQSLKHAVPDEVAAQYECPVVRQWNTDDMTEHQDQNCDGDQWVEQGPHESEKRPLVFHLEVADDHAAQQLPVLPYLGEAGWRIPRADDSDHLVQCGHAAYRSLRERAITRATGYALSPIQQFHHIRSRTETG